MYPCMQQVALGAKAKGLQIHLRGLHLCFLISSPPCIHARLSASHKMNNRSRYSSGSLPRKPMPCTHTPKFLPNPLPKRTSFPVSSFIPPPPFPPVPLPPSNLIGWLP